MHGIASVCHLRPCVPFVAWWLFGLDGVERLLESSFCCFTLRVLVGTSCHGFLCGMGRGRFGMIDNFMRGRRSCVEVCVHVRQLQ